MINVHILDLADTSACYNGTIKHIFELAFDLQKQCKVKIHIFEDGFDDDFRTFMYYYMKLVRMTAIRNDESFAIELNISTYENGTPEGWLIGVCEQGIFPTHHTFESLLMNSRLGCEIFIVPWRMITGDAFQKIATRMYEEKMHADIIVPVTEVSKLVTTNPMIYPIVYDYRCSWIWKPFKTEDYDRRTLADDPYRIENAIKSDMMKHYIRPDRLDFAPELTYLYSALYAEPMVDYEPCDTEESMSRMRKDGATE